MGVGYKAVHTFAKDKSESEHSVTRDWTCNSS